MDEKIPRIARGVSSEGHCGGTTNDVGVERNCDMLELEFASTEIEFYIYLQANRIEVRAVKVS